MTDDSGTNGIPNGKAPVKLDAAKAAEIRRLYAEEGRSARRIARQFGVHHRTIQDVLHGRTWADPAATPPPGTATAADQAWRDRVAASQTKRRPTRPLPVEKYDALWRAWQERQEIGHLVSQVGVSEITARKYVDEGDPQRGLRPLRERLARVQEQRLKAQDYSLTQSRKEQLQTARAIMQRLAQKIQAADPAKIPEARMSRMLAELQGVMERTFLPTEAAGAAAGDRFARWSEAELDAFFATGELPAHDVAVFPAAKSE